MFGDLVAGYLFLGGLGGGMYLAWCVLCRLAHKAGAAAVRAVDRTAPAILGAALGAVVLGMLCLLADSTRPGQTYLLVLRPTYSAVSVGFFALVAFCLLLVALLALRSGRFGRPGPVVTLAKVAAGLVSGVVIVYAGMLLYEMKAVPFWSSPLVPALFVVSACSTGLAAVAVLYLARCGRAVGLARPVRGLAVLDGACIVVELVLTLLLFAGSMGDAAAEASVDMLLCGELALWFWVGWMGLGIVAPSVLEVAGLVQRTLRPILFVGAGACVLAGGFLMRYCMIHAGIHMSAFMFAGIY